jgi:menaquinone-dependent protoporphyrinogen oxidase
MKVLILYSTTDGQTRNIASYIASVLQVTDVCDVIDLRHAQHLDLQRYQKVVVGASIRYGHFNPLLEKFIKQNLEILNQMPSAFYAVNLTARKPEKRTVQTNPYVRKFLIKTPWKPALSTVFAGALRYPRYRWMDRLMIQFIMRLTGGETDTSKDVEYTDWDDVTRFAEDIAKMPYEK